MINLKARLHKLEKHLTPSITFENLTEQERNCLTVYLNNSEEREWLDAMNTNTDEQVLKKYYPKYKKELFYWFNRNNKRGKS